MLREEERREDVDVVARGDGRQLVRLLLRLHVEPDCASTSCSSVSSACRRPCRAASPPAPSSAAAAAGAVGGGEAAVLRRRAPPAGELARVRTRLAGLSRPSAPGRSASCRRGWAARAARAGAGSAGGSGGSAGRAAPGRRVRARDRRRRAWRPPRPRRASPTARRAAPRGRSRGCAAAAAPAGRRRWPCARAARRPRRGRAAAGAAAGAPRGSASTPTCALSCAINWVLSTWPALYACSNGLRSRMPGASEDADERAGSIEPEEERAAGEAARRGRAGSAHICVARASWIVPRRGVLERAISRPRAASRREWLDEQLRVAGGLDRSFSRLVAPAALVGAADRLSPPPARALRRGAAARASTASSRRSRRRRRVAQRDRRSRALSTRHLGANARDVAREADCLPPVRRARARRLLRAADGVGRASRPGRRVTAVLRAMEAEGGLVGVAKVIAAMEDVPARTFAAWSFKALDVGGGKFVGSAPRGRRRSSATPSSACSRWARSSAPWSAPPPRRRSTTGRPSSAPTSCPRTSASSRSSTTRTRRRLPLRLRREGQRRAQERARLAARRADALLRESGERRVCVCSSVKDAGYVRHSRA